MGWCPLRFPGALWRHRELGWRLAEREVVGRYRGSVLGWSWSFLTPLLMLAVYTFVFSEVFQSRWGTLEHAGPIGFAINLFAGLIAFNIFAETTTKAPSLIVENANLVTKVIFPLEILAAVSVASACFHALTSLVVLTLFQALARVGPHPSLLWLPLVWLPLAGGCLALSWMVSALGVFLRDLGQVLGVVVNLLMFLSAVFYPVSSLPPQWQPLIQLNPLVLVIEQTRQVAVAGLPPSPLYLGLGLPAALLACECGYRLFQKSRRGFADVL
ncbi:ABC transporter permease [Vulcanococcus limneticus]|uniref:ABC transporter permease n=1 Tax=Vulcanococcus limneticus TaxID=2170428 RepID=UPI00398C04CA